MFTSWLYEGSQASTAQAHRERLEFARTLAAWSGAALVMMTGLFLWSALALFPLAETHGAVAAAILAIKAVAAVVIALDAAALVEALHGWRREARALARQTP
ncbi:hypothetical protein [Xylanimonas ulmi]|uniref:Uncharacterized protein n=1 Tax=Xylanimonas ulmi TaxID=228973 RepID=A0A4Q7M8C9_9MICO|nr:hypothetical protein [Xylanibacterium ulmi]RZS62958.1 hypothetical protein EV386_3315 [Xylanibacterium ulmi]